MKDLIKHEYFARKALEEAHKAFDKGEVPIGAVIVIDNKGSIVICPLGIEYPIGVAFIKYKSEMMGLDLQFDLLNSLAETISYSLEQYIQK